MTNLTIFLIWYIIGVISVTFARHIYQYYKTKKTEVTPEDIFFIIITGILGPLIALMFILNYIHEKGLMTKPLLKFKKPPYKGDE